MTSVSAYGTGAPSASFVVLDNQRNVLASHGSTRPYYAASTIKLAVLVAAMLKVDAGELTLDQRVVVADRFPSRMEASGLFGFHPDETDAVMPPPGQTMALTEVLGRMIYASSNAATNLVIDLVGLPEISRALAICGAPTAKMERLISDHAARDAGFTHEATALDLANIMYAIVTVGICTAQSTDFMVSLLQQQQFPVIGTVVPSWSLWGSKSGWVEGIHHDVAFVGKPGERDSFILAVCTEGFENDHAKVTIAALAAAVCGPRATQT
jgi:beta-lactamase class A